MADGRTLQLIYLRVEGDRLVGRDRALPIAEIRSIEKTEFSVARTAGLVAVGVGVYAILLNAFAKKAFGDGAILRPQE